MESHIPLPNPDNNGVTPQLYNWLLDADPSIRWQVMRDLLESNNAVIAKEQGKVATEGWGAQLLAHQDESGRWGGQLYINKWLSTTYSMRLLHYMGLEPDNTKALRGCRELLDGGYQANGGITFAKKVQQIDNAVTGMILSILAYFNYYDDRIHNIADYLISEQMPDGRWEPEAGNTKLRYTFDGTLLILQGLHEYKKKYPTRADRVIKAQERGREFLLSHKLFKDRTTNRAIDHNITLFSFPPRWHYDVLVALDYFQDCKAPHDARLHDAIDLLKSKCNSDGSWNLQNRHAGKTFFEMEEPGQPSKWNTLRALRVLRWWEGIPAT